MATATINRYISLLRNSFEALSAIVPIDEVEKLAMLIHHSMDQGHRIYHVSKHVFDMCENMNPIQTLAALFHDIVYYQLDNGFPRMAENLLKHSIQVDKITNTLSIRNFNNEDKAMTICSGVFGYKASDTLQLYGGMNEFLSAIVAVRVLEKYLPHSELIEIVVCIEATIPFRGIRVDGTGPFDLLALRINSLSRSLNLTFSEEENDKIICDAVEIANQDVSSFAVDDPGIFLSTTWLLIEESNAPLASVGIYSIKDYREALMRMAGFLSTLNPDHIFHQYKDLPDKENFSVFVKNARNNISFSIDYLGAKIVGIALVEALANLTGGNCPVSMFLGDIRSPYGKPTRAVDFLPTPPDIESIDKTLIHVLEHGRKKETNSDLTVSPLTSFVYRYLGHESTKFAFLSAKQMFVGKITPDEYISGLNRDMVSALIKACANIALSRRERLLELESRLTNAM